jgi:hypothetical protein
MRAYHRLGAGRFAVADLRAVDPLGGLGAMTMDHIDTNLSRRSIGGA